MVRLLLAAIVAGLLAGALMTAVHMVRVVPLIMEAELYENGEAGGHTHGSQAQSGSMAHGQGGLLMRDGWQRHAKTLVFNMIIGAAFALLLTAGMLVVGQPISLQSGVAWGAAGFVTFILAPAAGLPPELPGTVASDLVERQLWWLATVVATAGGLALLAYRRSAIWIVSGLVLIAAPHIWGAPQVDHLETDMPAGMAADFAIASVVAAFIFWIALGALLGHFLSRAAREEQV